MKSIAKTKSQYSIMDNTLVYGLGSLGVGLLALLIKYSFKSKCSDVSLCFGLIHIQRDIEQELEEQKIENNSHSPKRELSLRNLNSV
jgi:hypothetical protein